MGKPFYILVALFVGASAFAEPALPDHLMPEEAGAPAGVAGQNTPGRTREQILVEGLKNANLDPRALEMIERAFKDNPRIGQEDFVKTVQQLSGQNADIFKPEQVEGLKKLFNETLANVNGEPGKELAQAARKVLKEAAKTGEPIADKKDAPPEGDPQLADKLNAQIAQGINPAPLGMGAGADQLGMFGLLKELLGGDKDKEDKGGAGDMRPQPPAPPQPTHRGDRGGEREDKKKDDRDRGLLDALNKNRGGGGGMPSPPSSGSDDKKKEEEKKAAPAPSSESRKKPTDDAADDKKDKKPETPTTPTDSILDGLKNAGGPPAKRSPLNPLAGGGGGMGGGMPPGFGGGMPSGGGGAGGGGAGGMPMGGGGMGGGGGGGSSFSSDVFNNLGAGGPYPGGGIAGGSGFNIVREGGYAGANGGGGAADGEEGSGTEGDSSSPLAFVARMAGYADQIDMTPNARNTGMSLVEKMSGFVGTKLCDSEDNAKSVGFCAGLALRKNRSEFTRRIGNAGKI